MNVNQWISSLSLNQLCELKDSAANGSIWVKKYGKLLLYFIEGEIEYRHQLKANKFKYYKYKPIRK